MIENVWGKEPEGCMILVADTEHKIKANEILHLRNNKGYKDFKIG